MKHAERLGVSILHTLQASTVSNRLLLHDLIEDAKSLYRGSAQLPAVRCRGNKTSQQSRATMKPYEA